jgi:hypothetical protein
MFQRRSLPEDVAAVRDAHAPESFALDVGSDLDTLPPAVAEDLGLYVDAIDPAVHDSDWLPEDAPEVLRRYAGSEFTVGMPGDGTVAWTRQTEPPLVLVKSRAEGTPEDFLAFLVADAFVRIGTDAPEHALPFFGERYRELDAAVPLGPTGVYQLAVALYDGWLGLRTRDTFADWDPDGRLFDAWLDAGDRLEPRLSELSGEVARGETDFVDATELACSALRHAVDVPTPFGALDTTAFVDHGAAYAVEWARKTFASLE